jgi:hypothetical protein
LETAAAVYRAIRCRVKGYFCSYSTGRASYSIHAAFAAFTAVPTTAAALSAVGAAGWATGRFIFKTLFCIEFLFPDGEDKLSLAIPAC